MCFVYVNHKQIADAHKSLRDCLSLAHCPLSVASSNTLCSLHGTTCISQQAQFACLRLHSCCLAARTCLSFCGPSKENLSEWLKADLLGQSASGKVRCIDLPSLKGVCTALSSICWVPSGREASGDKFQSLTAQCIIIALGCSAWMSTCHV